MTNLRFICCRNPAGRIEQHGGAQRRHITTPRIAGTGTGALQRRQLDRAERGFRDPALRLAAQSASLRSHHQPARVAEGDAGRAQGDPVHGDPSADGVYIRSRRSFNR